MSGLVIGILTTMMSLSVLEGVAWTDILANSLQTSSGESWSPRHELMYGTSQSRVLSVKLGHSRDSPL
ncbi:hypothetical protein OGAPHI_003387 [Ogataea philodendri]|uniref:Secreted protein n=1 Tax=Ogataea philodendri TaxID=1378263 RepID=A0A9P8P7X8_9ASCO|nr:uncharacterized protein OGAPHI_003387 [Ogataea philodendri]KAH3666937.1 hypothetical protein OGAPHI_003387 [Ogataea philodendri]